MLDGPANPPGEPKKLEKPDRPDQPNELDEPARWYGGRKLHGDSERRALMSIRKHGADPHAKTTVHDVIQLTVFLRAVRMGIVTANAGLADGAIRLGSVRHPVMPSCLDALRRRNLR